MSSHEWNAADYHRNSAMQQMLAGDFMRLLHLRGDEHLLDIGCGDGKITASLAQRLPRGAAVGVDLSQGMIAFAQRNFPAAQHPNLSFQVMNAARLEFEHEFDVVVSFSALHWVPDQPAVLRGIARALKAQGRALMQFGGKGNMGVLDNIARELPSDARWGQYYEGFTYPWGFHDAAQYRRWVVAAGLRAQRVELVVKDVKHAGRAGFAAWIRTAWPPYVQRIPAELRDEFLADLTERYLQHAPPDAEGMVHVRMVRMEVEVTKP